MKIHQVNEVKFDVTNCSDDYNNLRCGSRRIVMKGANNTGKARDGSQKERNNVK